MFLSTYGCLALNHLEIVGEENTAKECPKVLKYK
jgi:hypothetical protein